MGDEHDDAEAGMAATSKVDLEREETPSSIASTPEQLVAPDAALDQPQPQKRKGGRKPIYATSEERKQRNRQAQAAFRERRTEYIKQLEATIKQNDETLANLQHSHRTAADECLMLRYKNSLLERILLEKGVDVQAELQLKTGNPILGPAFMHAAGHASQTQPQQPPAQRTVVQRRPARRSTGQAFLPKLAPDQSGTEGPFAAASPHGHPTPSSHASSPTNLSSQSPLIAQQGGMTPPTSAVLAQGYGQQFHHYVRSSQAPPNHAPYRAQQQTSPSTQRQTQWSASSSDYPNIASTARSVTSQANFGQQMSLGSTSAGGSALPTASAYYPSPFQKHFDQLEQEYDNENTRSMLDIHPDDRHDQSSDPPSTHLSAAYPPHLEQAQRQAHQGELRVAQSGQLVHSQFEGVQMVPPSHAQSTTGSGGSLDALHAMIDPNDPMLDADPFGLSASMHYPTSYSSMGRPSAPS